MCLQELERPEEARRSDLPLTGLIVSGGEENAVPHVGFWSWRDCG